MINYENIEVENLFTEGFVASLPSAMNLVIGAGSMEMVNTEGNVTFSFPEIDFDVVADPELYVKYDVYLLEENNVDGVNIQVNRTELGYQTIAVYEGEAKLLHQLLSFTMPPGATDLGNVDITVRNVILTPKEASTIETPTE